MHEIRSNEVAGVQTVAQVQPLLREAKGFSSAIGQALAFAGHARLTQRVFLRVCKGVLGVERA
jgi:hypothetical protein